MANRGSSSLPVLALAVLAACSPERGPAEVAPASRPWRTLEVTNEYRMPVQLYPQLSGTTLWTRMARVPPYATVRVRIPAAYLRRDFQVVVCRTSGVLGEPNCVRTGRYLNNDPVPRLVVFPSERLHAELFG